MSKIKLFLDIDNCITNSTKAFCHCYNLFYNFKPDFIPAQYKKVDKWDFTDQCTLIKSEDEVERIFGMTTFFANLEFMDRNTYKVLEKLNKKYELYLISIGTPDNISNKTIWVKRNLPFIQNSIFLVNLNKLGKGIINMKDGIIVDDVEENLYSSNASEKICFGKVASWNLNWNGDRSLDWLSIEKRLL
jgi:5'(3')-deoxyribonucleotidase